jgi:transposase, IS30 family
MSNYTPLSLEERCSIVRELRRNTGRKIGYQPAYAQAQTSARRWSGSRLERDDTLRETVLKRLAAGWSPEQIAGRLAREEGHKAISHETIYRFVYAQFKRANNITWRLYPPRAKIKRGWPRTDGKCSIHTPFKCAPRYKPKPAVNLTIPA